MKDSGFFKITDPAEQRRILSALLGRQPQGNEAGDDAEARAKLKALGWTDDDLCMLVSAQQYTLRFQQVQQIAAHLGCAAHGHLEAARVSVAMIDLALALQERIDAAFALIAWPTRPTEDWAAMRAHREHCAADVKRLEDEAALRAELAAGGAS